MHGQTLNLKVLGGIFLAVFALVVSAYAEQDNTGLQPLKPGMTLAKAAPLKIGQPLRTLKPAGINPATPSAVQTFEDGRLVIPRPIQKTTAKPVASSVMQSLPGLAGVMPSPIANFDGVNNVSGYLPPDTQGDIGWDPATGRKYYLQWVNVDFQIWDVTVAESPQPLLAAPLAGNSLWAGTGTLCESHNDGDPLTRFDALANRWVMSQFALSFPDDFHQCIAVSQTADPTGDWYLYDFKTSTTVMNDYGKLGIWADGYYMSFNQFDGYSEDWRGAGVAVFERDKMLLGQDARMIYFDTGAASTPENRYGGMLPADLDGPAPPAGTPNYFVEWDDSSWQGDVNDTLRIWEFRTDWANISNTTFGLNAAFDPNLQIATADVDANLCNWARGCIPQPDTAARLDAISDRLMYRLQYRNFGTYQTLVGNHTIDASATDKAGIHWFELRNSGAGFAMHQEGVYAPDSDNRWMGSIAMDATGNMALGYSVASSTTYPSVRYSGRLANDPAGILPQGETTMVAGSGSQTHSAARWGDYSMMAVDPADGCTFWYTQEYMQITSVKDWQTRIGSFRFPNCTSVPLGMLSGTVSDAAAAALAGVTISISPGGYSTVTDTAGHYMIPLPGGTYTVTATKYGYVTGSAAAVVVTAPDTTSRDFTLAAAPTVTITGLVTDAAAGWPLYARINIQGYPGSPVFTNPVTGAYAVPLVAGDYTFTVTAMSGGYKTATAAVVVTATDAVQDFGLTVDSAACSAPGYQLVNAGSVLSLEKFDAATAPAFPANWAVEDFRGTSGDWTTMTASLHPAGITPHSPPNMAVFNSFTADRRDGTRLHQTDDLVLSNQHSVIISFWMHHDAKYRDFDRVRVQVSTNAGVTWTDIGIVLRNNGSSGWVRHAYNLDVPTGTATLRVGLLGVSAYGNDIHIDDIAVSTRTVCSPIASYGLVIGTVRDGNTGAPLTNATVTGSGGSAATMIDAAADPAAPARMYVIAQPAGIRVLTATAPRYASVSVTPTIVAGGTTGQDMSLPVGRLAVTPSNLSFELSALAPTASLPLSLDNSGGLAANYEIIAVKGLFGGYTPTGPFAAAARHTGPKSTNDLDASAVRVDLTPRNVTRLAAGEVSASWDTGLANPWGIGFNTAAADLWVSNPAYSGGDDLDYRFTTAGVNTGDTIDTAPWIGAWAGDMTYNPYSKTLWQVNVGGDNCIYELDPAAKTATGNRICPAFPTSQRGLAFNPLTNTYYSGSFNDDIINHFAPDGTILDSKDVGLSISGLAFNPSSGHLFVMTNADTTSDPTKFDVYVLDTRAAYANLGGFNLKTGGVKTFADWGQAGLELDCDGNLWAVDRVAKKVHQAGSGESDVCNWQATWLAVAPPSGNVAGGEAAALTVNADASGLAPGVYNAHLRAINTTPYGPLIVPVTLNVNPTVSYHGNGSSGGALPAAPAAYQPGTTVTVLGNSNSLTRTGHTFSGWNSQADGNGTTYAAADTFSMGNANITLYALWTLNSYSVSFASNGGSAIASQTTTYNTATPAPAAPVRTGYTFSGWHTDSSLTIPFDFSTPITADLTLFAKWTLNSYSVTFASNGGSNVASQTTVYNTAITAPTAPVRTGHTFGGWYSDSGLTTPFDFATPLSADLTLFARWALNRYTVSFASNGGSAVASQTADYNSATTAPAAPSRAEYTFNGWYTDSGHTTPYDFSTPVTADLILQAKWTIVSYSVTPSAGSGSNIAPNSPLQVDSGLTTSFTVTADAGYGILAASGCNGTLNGSVFTTGPITGNCSIAVTAIRHSGSGSSGATPTMTDVLKALQAYNGSVALSPQEQVVYDVAPLAANGIPQGDGQVDIFDVFLILRRTIGIGYW